MERIWAPWRMKYISNADNTPEGCVFCAAAAAENDSERLVLRRDEHAYTIMNLYPYSNGHLMIVPYRHVGDLTQLSAGERLALMDGAVDAVKALRAALNCDAHNLGMNLGRTAGAGIDDHVHLHVVPRWHGDTNFMVVLDDTRVISEALTDTYGKLLAAYDKMER